MGDQVRQIGDHDAARAACIRLGEIINQAISTSVTPTPVNWAAPVAEHVGASTVREPTHEMDGVYVALLAETADQEQLAQAVSNLAHGDWQSSITIPCSADGPYRCAGAPPGWPGPAIPGGAVSLRSVPSAPSG
ncbi:MAG TPA: hypothetical protein VIV12_07860, partial [Streptosporangiaceae bacterium]